MQVVPRDLVCRANKSTHWKIGCFLGHDNIVLQVSRVVWIERKYLHIIHKYAINPGIFKGDYSRMTAHRIP